jgi:hypothetical protein
MLAGALTLLQFVKKLRGNKEKEETVAAHFYQCVMKAVQEVDLCMPVHHTGTYFSS